MRRKDKQITDEKEILEIIQKADTLRIAMIDNGKPYIVPLNYGFRDNAFYIHSAAEGRKIDILKSNPYVCFEIDTGHKLVTGENACDWGMAYKSIIGYGNVKFIGDNSGKAEALDILMGQYDGHQGKNYKYPEEMLKRVAIIKIEITEMTAKKSK